jgi:tRNA nucleotidyltransferase (CCA-adding enzyme)
MDVITTHINADFDALASMLAAKKLYPDAVLAFPGAQEKSIKDFLLKSAMYLLDIEKASKIPLEKIKRLILVDIRQASRIGKFASLCKKQGVEIYIYDHHPSSPDDIKGALEVIKPYGSTTTIMCQILKEKQIEITPDEATVLMLGIYEDTGNLTFSSTTVEDYNIAAYLLSQGANLNIVSDMVVKELTADQISILNELIENSFVHTIHGVDVMITKASSDSYVGDFAVLVHKLKNIGNVNVLFALANMDDRIYIVARSRIQEVNVGEILCEFGGGGHATAASATIHDITLTQVEQKLLRILKDTIKPVKVAKDFMASPVKTIDSNESLEKASGVLTRYNINVLPVTGKDKLVGLISRQIIEKAKHHGLKGIAVQEYMTTEFATVKSTTPLSEIKKYIIENNQRFLPVVDREKIKGSITRTDLLKILHVDTADDSVEVDMRSHAAQKKRMKSIFSERLPKQILSLLKDVGKVADSVGYNAYAVGGFVRDIFLRYPNYDIDIVIEGDGISFARTFASQYGYNVKVHRKFGTAVIKIERGLKIDVASSRLEYYERPAALPKVEWSSIKLDLYRRDFTVNTLAIRLNPNFFGELTDYFGARRDIKEKTIRVLHNLSFVEDPSRIFRAIRFEQRFGFHLSKLTKNLIENAVKMDFLNNLSGKRIFSELMLLLNEEQVDSIIKRLYEFELLKYLHSSIQYDNSLRTLLKNIMDVLSWHDLLYLDNRCERWFVFFLALIDRLKKKEVEKILRYFNIKKKYSVPIKIAKTTGNEVLYKMAQKRSLKNSEIYRYLHAMPVEVCLYLMAKTGRQYTKKAFSLYFTQLQNVRIHITGNDLIKLGIPPGKIYKKILEKLLDAVLDGKVKSKDEEHKFIKKYVND